MKLSEIFKRINFELIANDIKRSKEVEDILKDQGWTFIEKTDVSMPAGAGPAIPYTARIPISPEGEDIIDSDNAAKTYREARRKATAQVLNWHP